jgi:hypothetical protein
MSTNGMDSWAVDLADVGAIYPMQGTEFILFILGLVFWIWWHVAQFRLEAKEVQHEVDQEGWLEKTEASIKRY